ncbi:MAG: electron transfer flavoprotein subunit alpha/FixB family protein [bacterium]
MPGPILAILEQRNSNLRKSAYEVATAAAELAQSLGSEAVGLVIGADAPDNASGLGAFGITKVYSAAHAASINYVPEAYEQAVLAAIEKARPEVILLSASVVGKDLGPRVAAKLGVGLATDCTKAAIVDGKLEAVRPVYAGKAYLTLGFESTPQMASLRPNVFTPKESNAGAAAIVETLEFAPGEIKTVFKEFKQTGGEKVELSEAGVIVSGGRGLKGPENFHLVEELAASLGAAVGASRAVVDAGWRPHSEQVGQTGKTVSPNLYVAVGISGAIQHLAGMSSSKVIVAINKDQDAPIFTKADYGIVGDVLEVVPALTEEIKKLNT